MTDDFVKIFIDFLKKHKVLNQYVNNVARYRGNELLFFRNIFKQDPKEYVAGPFLWGCSPEGIDFWNGINQKWLKLIKDMK